MEWFKKIIEKATIEGGNIDIEILVKEFDKEFSQNAVIKAKYDEVCSQLETCQNQISDNNSIISQFEEADIEGLKAEIERLKENEKNIIKSNTIDLALINAGARNLKAARALLELEDEFDEDLLNTQIQNLSQSDESSFLFSQNNSYFGMSPVEGETQQEKGFDEMSYSEMCAYIERGIQD